ncbi:SDR family NAD(P)-dependent oxidoreductase [Sphingosinicella terrae]|jgi:NAD(P)-dependent dehydrogenase (short-subunit alcohol dehydrogenase family)|uniref:SDR family NAD(P)-dependent oxidoreductase n=1 Tax=Sphingosinicella terrae TaxID=2172047 RepID=UPI0013B46A7A|nr:SDR family NAD(P)-dependent oxidoreductase [Sphingosinicella terrae]
MKLDLEGRSAVVSGAGRGIGRALALHAARLGMRVHAWDVDVDGLMGLDSAIMPRRIDVSDADEVGRAAAGIQAGGEDVALLFCNAGILRPGRSWEIGAEAWRETLAVNVLGAANMIGALVPTLCRQARRSHIVITGSQAGFVARAGNAAYSGSKHALWALAEALKLELDEVAVPIGVSLLAPGPVRTTLAEAAAGAPMHQLLQEIGMPAHQVAEETFAAIRENRFWVFTHQDFKTDLQARVTRLIAEEAP